MPGYVMMTSSNGNIFRVTGDLCGEFTGPTQRPVTWSFDVFFDLRLNKRLSKQSWDWWFETLSCPLWRHCNGLVGHMPLYTIAMWNQYIPNLSRNHAWFPSKHPTRWWPSTVTNLHGHRQAQWLLTHWGREKMAAISQTTLSNAFSWMEKLAFGLKFHWSLFLRVQLTTFQHWFS